MNAVCALKLAYTLDSGHLFFMYLGPNSAPYMHLILNMFVRGKEENAALDWQQSPWTIH